MTVSGSLAALAVSPALIFWAGLGLEGAAWALLADRAISAALGVGFVIRKYRLLKLPDLFETVRDAGGRSGDRGAGRPLGTRDAHNLVAGDLVGRGVRGQRPRRMGAAGANHLARGVRDHGTDHRPQPGAGAELRRRRYRPDRRQSPQRGGVLRLLRHCGLGAVRVDLRPDLPNVRSDGGSLGHSACLRRVRFRRADPGKHGGPLQAGISTISDVPSGQRSWIGWRTS